MLAGLLFCLHSDRQDITLSSRNLFGGIKEFCQGQAGRHGQLSSDYVLLI